LNAPDSAPPPAVRSQGEPDSAVPRRWSLHTLNSAAIFGATWYGVTFLPRSVSYGIGHVGTWLAWKLLPSSRAAVAGNLRAISQEGAEKRALVTFRAYARDVIDFLRAIASPDDETETSFDFQSAARERFQAVLAEGRGMILVTGHYGNWEIGSVLMKRALRLPITVMVMPETSATVTRIRRRIRASVGAETIEVRRSLETALQIRRKLAENKVVAMLIDRHIGRDRVQVTLLGRQAWFLRTPALMGLMTGAPLVPCFIERSGRGRFNVLVGQVIRLSPTLPRDEAIREATQHFADQFSERLRVHPEYWYQFYSYWEVQRDERAGPDDGRPHGHDRA
jgi:lauroyl/myristoyl acyltransferase